jgi:hypothetical protein
VTICGRYLGDNDGTCPQLTCVRERGHAGLCDNVSSAPSHAPVCAACQHPIEGLNWPINIDGFWFHVDCLSQRRFPLAPPLVPKDAPQLFRLAIAMEGIACAVLMCRHVPHLTPNYYRAQELAKRQRKMV